MSIDRELKIVYSDYVHEIPTARKGDKNGVLTTAVTVSLRHVNLVDGAGGGGGHRAACGLGQNIGQSFEELRDVVVFLSTCLEKYCEKLVHISCTHRI